MTGRELREWANTLSDGAVVEVKRYDWEKLEPEKIRAIHICKPQSNASIEEAL